MNSSPKGLPWHLVRCSNILKLFHCVQIFSVNSYQRTFDCASTLVMSDACLRAFCGKFVNTLLDPVSSDFVSTRKVFESMSVSSIFEVIVSCMSPTTSLLTSFLTVFLTSLMTSSSTQSLTSLMTSSFSSLVWSNGFLPDGSSLVSFAHLDGGQMILVATPFTKPSGT